MTTSPWADASTWLFDCDGVLLDSNAVKTAAFVNTVQPYGDAVVRDVVEHHVANGGMSRYAKFDRLFDVVLGRPPAPGELEHVLDEFSRAARCRLLACDVDPHATELLGELRARGARSYVVTGGATDEVRELLGHHGLADSFVDILGSPTSKSAILARLADRGVLDDAVFVGDSRLDMEVSGMYGLRRIFVTHWSEFEQWALFVEANPDIAVVDDLAEVLRLERGAASLGGRSS